MNHTIALLTLALAATTVGCASHAESRFIDEDGHTWVRLSSKDQIVPMLRDNAIASGCWASPHAELDGNEETVLACRGEEVHLIQNAHWLGFRCKSLPASSCDRLIQSFSGDSERPARRGTAFGI